jgi:DNA repair exonuclease SbcCD ATPase subunit
MSHPDAYMVLAQENRDLRLRLDTCQVASVTREREMNGLLIENSNLRGVRDQLLADHQQYVDWAIPQLERLGREMLEIERLRAALSEALGNYMALKRTRDQEREYADVCYENQNLRELLRQWQFDVGGAMAELERETLAAINGVPQEAPK